MKILVVVILLSVSGFFQKAKSEDITLLEFNQSIPNQYNCLIERHELNSGIGWIYPLPNSFQLPQTSKLKHLYKTLLF